MTVLDVTTDPALGQRFLDHRALVEQQAARLPFEVDALSGNERKAERHRLQVLARDSSATADTAVATYGKDYRRGWASSTLKDRAARHGLAADYEVYGLTSSVLHGSAGGAVGTVRVDRQAGSVHRLGPALALCPLAFLRGLAYYRQIVETLVAHNGRPDVARRAAPVLDALDAALALWPEYRSAVVALDELLWASALPVSTLMTVLSLDRAGTPSWWLWDLATQRVAHATPPPDTPQGRSELAACQQQIGRFKDVYWRERRHVNIVMNHLSLSPVRPEWQDSDSLIHDERPEMIYAPGEEPRMVQKDSFAPPRVLGRLVPGGVAPLR